MKNYYIDYKVSINYGVIVLYNIQGDIDKQQEFIDLDKSLIDDINCFEYDEEYLRNEELWMSIYNNKDIHTFEISENSNQVDELIKFISNDVDILFGFAQTNELFIILDLLSIKVADNTFVYYKDALSVFHSVINKGLYERSVRFTIPELKHYNSIALYVDFERLLYLHKLRIDFYQALIALKWYKLLKYRIKDIDTDMYEIYSEKYDNITSIGNRNADEVVQHYNRYSNYAKIANETDILGLTMDCINSIFALREIHKVSNDELEVRAFVSEHYGLDLLQCLNASRSKLADILIIHLYSEYTGLKKNQFMYGGTDRRNVNISECISSRVKFRGDVPIIVNKIIYTKGKSEPRYELISHIKNLIDFHNLLKQLVVYSTKAISYAVTINDTIYTVKSGGLHSMDTPIVFTSNDKFSYIDMDGDSYYPNMVVHDKNKPAHLLDDILDIAADAINIRVKAKKSDNEMDKKKAAPMKIMLNSGFFGKFNSPFSWLRDVKAMLSTTMTGQLQLLMAIEDMEANGFKCVNANTDGIILRVDNDRKDEFYALCKQWEKKTNVGLSYTHYNSYHRLDVNNYIAFKTDGKVKQKGSYFNEKRNIDKGYYPPVISRALRQYIEFGIPLSKTIHESTDIHDFITTQNVNEDFNVIYHYVLNGKYVQQKLQKSIRYYVSNNGGSIKKDNIKLVSGFMVKVLLNVSNKDISEYDINYNYYIGTANTVLHTLSGNANVT